MTPEENQTTSLHRYAAWASTAAVLVAIAAGVFFTGTPADARLHKFDTRRLEDVRMIYGEVMNQTVGTDWRNPQVTPAIRTPLPATLEAVAQHAMRQRPRIEDPVTSQPYGYTVVNESTFKVCATFDTSRDEPGDVAWNHPAGQHCFTFDVFTPHR
jgi:hypothetical protein